MDDEVHQVRIRQDGVTQAGAVVAALVPIMTPEILERGSRLKAERWC